MAAGAPKRPRRPKTDPEALIDRINALSPAAFAQRFFPPSSTLLRYRDYEITLKSVTTIADGDFSSCFKLVESTSAADYKSSSRGWRPKDKLREMREDHMRYLLVRESRAHPAKCADSDRASHDGAPSELGTSTAGNDIVAFCSFMFTIEDDYPVVYIYEIHLAESHRRSGLGRHLMRIVEHCATEGAVDKAMLTCFRCNTLAMAFYTKLGYEEDEFSPPAKRLRGGKIKLPSYLIMNEVIMSATWSERKLELLERAQQFFRLVDWGKMSSPIVLRARSARIGLRPISARCAAKYTRQSLLQTAFRGSAPLARVSHGSIAGQITRSFSQPSQPFAPASATSATPLLEDHAKAVAKISADVRTFHERGEKFRISHGSTNSTRQSATRRKTNYIDTSGLSHVLKVDPESRTALVQPNVPMDRLAEETMKHGLIPPVIMEFPGITVGGGYSGTSGESSSFKYGYFDKTINWVEMVLATGEVIRCSPTEMADLFHGAAGAVGTFGVTTLVELQLKEAKMFVETTYHPVSSVAEAVELSEQFIKEPDTYDYVDGILFSPAEGAIVTGRATNKPSANARVQTFSSAKDPWFYLHVQDQIKTGRKKTEAIPLAEYLFRYDRGGFWVGRSAFEYFRFPFSSWTRWWLDDFLHTRMLYSALHASGQSKRYVVQDLALPFATAEKFINYTTDKFGIWPLWLCPLKQSPQPTMHPNNPSEVEEVANVEKGTTETQLKPLLNIGLWGWAPKHAQNDFDAFADLNRDLEAKLRELGGMKWLYAHTYYTEDEFWQTYANREWYDELRKKYGAEGLPSVYEKVKVDVEAEKKIKEEGGLARKVLDIWPIGGIYAIRKAIQSGLYWKHRNATWNKQVGR